MWSLTKLDFLFYDFPVIYYDFQSFNRNKKEKENSKPLLLSRTTSGDDLSGFEKLGGVIYPVS
jgi:hypothetical protein